MAASSSSSSHRERPIEERFERAVAVIRSLPQDGPYQPSNMVKLKFYALYKQARDGPNKTTKPGFWDPTARAKWEAWTQCGNMSREECMKMYVEELQRLVETMPQTKQVEEFLVSIGPFYEIVEDEEEEKEKEVDDMKKTDEVDSDEDDQFHDSVGDLPSSLLDSSVPQNGSSPLPPPSPNSTSSPLNTASPSASMATRSDLTGRGGGGEGFGVIRRSVRFADRSETWDGQSGFTAGGSRVLPPVPVFTGMISQIQQNLQAVLQQLTSLSRTAQNLEQYNTQLLSSSSFSSSQEQGDEEGRRRGRRRRGNRTTNGTLLVATVVCPVAVNIIFAYLSKKYTGVNLPQWMWGALTVCNIAVSLVLVCSR